MKHNYKFTNVNEALPRLMHALLEEGDEFGSRAGRTLELMHVGITLEKPWQREIVLPDRKASIAAQVVETMWVLSGRNDVAGLVHYLPRATDFSDDGVEWRAGYGPRLREYQGVVDQLDYVVGTLADSPGSRQAVATLWEPNVDTIPGKDIACNNWLSFSSRLGYLDLHVGIRSNDAVWGWSGINTFEWSALQEVVAGLLGLLVGGLHFSVTSFHLYDRHWEKARRIAESENNFRRIQDSPRFDAEKCWSVGVFDDLTDEWFYAERMIRHGNPLAGKFVDAFPEPMLRSWLRVLQWYWSGDEGFLTPLAGTRLYEACLVSVKPAGEPQDEQLEMEVNTQSPPPLLPYINQLHAEKHAAYGDSWRRRGEPGILSNIARKVDRLDMGADTSDESHLDTAIDLVVYLAKYLLWLEGKEDAAPPDVAVLLGELPGAGHGLDYDKALDQLFTMPTGRTDAKVRKVYLLLDQSLGYARSVWR